MKLALILIAVAAFVIAAVLTGASRPAAAAPADARAMYESMRTLALTTQAADLGIDSPGPEATVYGIVWDMDVDGETATITSFETGDASLYVSTGGGTIGGGGHASVADAARRFVAIARDRLGAMTRTGSFPRPGRGAHNFYVLTTAGVFAATRSEAALSSGTDDLSPLFDAGQEVITQIRLISPPE